MNEYELLRTGFDVIKTAFGRSFFLQKPHFKIGYITE